MRRLLWAMGIFLSLGIPAFAQGGIGGGGQPADDHNDAAPVQSGYAVITPAFTGPGLTVLETFGLKVGEETVQAGFASSELLTNGTLFVDVADRLGRNVGVALANPNAAAAAVTFTLRNADGTHLGTQTISVPPRNQTARFVTELIPVQPSGGIGGQPAPLTEYTGTLSIASSLPVSVIGLRFRGSTFSTMPVTIIGTSSPLPVLSLGIGGASGVLLPQFAADGGWATQIVISNANSSAASVRLDLFKGDGTPLTATLNGVAGSSFTNLSVPAGGVLVLAPRDMNGDDRF
jgi:hypothetical protein